MEINSLEIFSQQQNTPVEVSNTASKATASLATNANNISHLTQNKESRSTADALFDILFRQKTDQPTLFASKDKDGHGAVQTEDGYRITFKAENQEWVIVHPSGKKTRIWGDPHVNESDGDSWDFKAKTTFEFGNNKITVSTTPAGNGQTYTRKVSIYNGNHRITIDGIDKNQPNLVSWKFDREVHDAALSDGTVYKLSRQNNQETWLKKS